MIEVGKVTRKGVRSDRRNKSSCGDKDERINSKKHGNEGNWKGKLH